MECPFHFYCICMLLELILSFVYGKISQTDNLIGGTVRLKNINVQLSIVDVQQIIRIALDEKPQEALAFIKENLFKTEKQTSDLTFYLSNDWYFLSVLYSTRTIIDSY
jgi:hypothetical protein